MLLNEEDRGYIENKETLQTVLKSDIYSSQSGLRDLQSEGVTQICLFFNIFKWKKKKTY